jgi:hypothetical protein
MKVFVKIFSLVLLILIMPLIVSAHPGRTDPKGCHTCKTNCEKWGLKYGKYHCHNSPVETKSIRMEARKSAR